MDLEHTEGGTALFLLAQLLFLRRAVGRLARSRLLGLVALAFLAVATGSLTALAGIAASTGVLMAVAISDTVAATPTVAQEVVYTGAERSG